MDSATLIALFASTVAAATPLVYAALGELVTERAGVLNLGVEGMMLIGAVTAFAVGSQTGNLGLACLAAAAAAAAMALLFALLTLGMLANQVATGLALTLFGVGLSSFIGKPFVGQSIEPLATLPVPLLADLPVLGPLLFRHNLLVYGSLLLLMAVSLLLRHSHAGLRLRAVGENPAVAHRIGHPVLAIRYLATLFGGACAGLGGAYLSIALTPMWVEGLSAGRGWIALALVVFATWKPLRVLLGAYLFGGMTVLQLHAQGHGLPIPSEFLSMLPYLATIAVLVIICRNGQLILLNQPASLGKPFHPQD